MGKVAFVFPGQASQYSGMGKELAEKYPVARAVFDEADKALGFSVSKLCFEGTEDDLKLTANTQPAILTVSVAAGRVLAEKGIAPDDLVIESRDGSVRYPICVYPKKTAWTGGPITQVSSFACR